MAKKGKRYRQAMEVIGSIEKPINLSNALGAAKKVATAKFDESINIDLKLGVDPRHADQMVRGSVNLPHGTGKDIRILVLANEGKQPEAVEAGADHVGLDDYIQKIQDGWTDIDVIIATPDVMGKLGRIGRILGPRGLMPNPKSGTVTMDIAEAVKASKAGKIDFRVDKNGNLHAILGKASFGEVQLQENTEAFLREIIRLRPSTAKGTYIQSITISTAMGPGIHLDKTEVINSLR